MAEEKLPKELAAKQAELQIYEKVINQRNISREHLSELQEQVNHHLLCSNVMHKIHIIFYKI